jgi:methyl-accepting chemotaxis protein
MNKKENSIMKKTKMVTKIGVGFTVIELIVIMVIYFGYATAQAILVADDPERYLMHYRVFTLILFIAVLMISTAIAASIIHALRKSLKQLNDAGKELAVGNVDIELKKRKNDEFGAVIDQYQEVVNNIHYQADIAEAVAEGDLMVEVETKSEKDLMGLSLKKLVDRNLNALTNINDAANQVMTSSSEVASASEALAQGSTEQASAIEQITASIGDITDKTKQNADKANTAKELMTQAIVDVQKGNEAMQGMMTAMSEINSSSESISKIIKVIDDIAFQTNILALNAAVEAARAGEAGKGFAVVAEEVRNLAAKSAAAASETAELIEDSIRKVEAGSGIADGTAKALENITRIVQESETLINDIAEASNYQATAIAQIDQAVEQVSQVVQNNSATSEECAASSVDLSNQANRMRELLAVYNLGEPKETADTLAYHGADDYAAEAERNEQIISLKDGFGKY